MRPLQFTLLAFLALLLMGCGAGHPNLTSIAVSPNSATAAPQQDVVFTANGTFTNNSSRELTIADGLTWKTSNSAMATINDNGTPPASRPEPLPLLRLLRRTCRSR